jgi:F0F1-type ATP synthase assembly protein I
MMSRSRKPWRAYGRYGSIGIELVLSIGLGYYGGAWLDTHFHTKGWFAGAGFFLGCYAGFKALWVAAKRMERDVERDEAQDRGEDPWDDDEPSEPSEPPPPADGPKDEEPKNPRP